MNSRVRITVIVTAVLALTALPVLIGAAVHNVSMTGSATFSPANLTIDQGDTVKWTNISGLIHTSTSGTPCVGNGTWNSGDLFPLASFSFTFNSPGGFDYFCIPHCLIGMRGKITVEPPIPALPSTWGKIKKLYEAGGL